MELIRTETTQEKQKPGRESIFQDFVAYARKATSGMAQVAETEGKALIQKLAQVAGISSEEQTRLEQNLSSRIEHSKIQLQAGIEKSVDQTVERVIEASKRELTRLEAKVAELEKKLSL